MKDKLSNCHGVYVNSAYDPIFRKMFYSCIKCGSACALLERGEKPENPSGEWV